MLRRGVKPSLIRASSIAGLLAARICSDHFKEVVIIDPDNDELVARACASLPETPGGKCDPEIGHHPRPRVAQSRVFHATQGALMVPLQLDFRIDVSHSS